MKKQNSDSLKHEDSLNRADCAGITSIPIGSDFQSVEQSSFMLYSEVVDQSSETSDEKLVLENHTLEKYQAAFDFNNRKNEA